MRDFTCGTDSDCLICNPRPVPSQALATDIPGWPGHVDRVGRITDSSRGWGAVGINTSVSAVCRTGDNCLWADANYVMDAKLPGGGLQGGVLYNSYGQLALWVHPSSVRNLPLKSEVLSRLSFTPKWIPVNMVSAELPSWLKSKVTVVL